MLDLTLARMRQAREVIWERQIEDRRRDLSVREVELKTLASFMAQTPEALSAAKDIRLLAPDPDEPKQQNLIPFERAQRLFSGGA